MSGELQTIPARHGVATFVPRGRTIKVINTYGKQVVSMWAFSLGAPPGEGDDEVGEDEEVEREAEELREIVDSKKEGEQSSAEKEQSVEKGKKNNKETETIAKETVKPQDSEEKPLEQAPMEKATESTAPQRGQTSKRTWASYLPSMPYRNKANTNKPDAPQKPTAAEEKAQNEENTRKWSSYLPTGKGFSSYVPNMQIPDSKDVVSAFKSSHYRDPNKSYAEQLYDFSKTPVGAGTLAAATGSGYASSVYAAYSAYASTHPSKSSRPPMEYLSLPHTRAASHKLVPEVNDELLTNLRNPIITLIEDTTPGAHDTLTAACDANLYTALSIEKPEEHGSCAENLVLALKELNENAGLKGTKAVGADITVNIAPTPLHLFMNAPLSLSTTTSSSTETSGTGAKGTTLTVLEPTAKRRSFVRFRAERDVVLVFSACPMDIGKQNGGRCMAANFLVEDVAEGEDLASSVASLEKKKAGPRKLGGKGGKGEKELGRKDSGVGKAMGNADGKEKEKMDGVKGNKVKEIEKKEDEKKENKTKAESQPAMPADVGTPTSESQPKRKPKKLEVRRVASPAPANTSS